MAEEKDVISQLDRREHGSLISRIGAGGRATAQLITQVFGKYFEPDS